MKKISFLIVVASLAFAGAAHAQLFTGSIAVGTDLATPLTATYTSSSLTLNLTNFAQGSGTGTFALVPSLSDVTAYSTTISGLSSTPLTLSIPDFFVFSSADPDFGASGTTPENRFEFNLATITDAGGGIFKGTGTLVDTQGQYAATLADFTLSYSSSINTSPGDYSFTLSSEGVAVEVAAPEPSTWAMLLGGFVLLAFWRLRARRA